MASLVLGALGGFMFGPIGFLGGSLLGNLLFPGKVEGPRLTNLKLQGSDYGRMIPIPYGQIRLAGQVVWQTDLQEHKHTSGGKGGPEVTTYTYTASFAVKVCKGPINDIVTIWANGEVVYDTTGLYQADNSAVPLAIYTGVEDAQPDPTMESVLGVGNVPAFRDDAACVFTDWDLGAFGNTLPNLSFLVQVKGGQPSAIFKVRECHTNPPHQWCYSAVTSGISSDHGTQFPYITHWALDGSPIRVLSVLPGTDPNPSMPVYLYDNTSLQQTGNDSQGPDEANIVVPVTFSGANFGWGPVGSYVYNDNSRTPLWRNMSTAATIGATTTNCAYGSGSVAVVGGTLTTAKNFAFDAGISDTEHIYSCALSQDGRIFLVLTNTTAGSRPTKWYRIVNGVVASSGTCASGLNIIGIANTGLRFGPTLTSGQAVFNTNTLENGGEFLWCFTTNNAYQPTTTSPLYAGSVGIATLYRIDPNTGILDWYSFGKAAFATDPNGPGTGYAGVCSPADGYFGVVFGASVVLFSRNTGAGPTYLSEIVSDVSVRCGLSTGDIDVTDLTQLVDGYLITTRADGRTDLDPLRSAYYFDAVERQGKAVFINRGANPSLTIPDNDLAAQQKGETPPPLVEVERAQETDLPVSVNVTYINKDAAYQNGSQQAIRQTVIAQSVADVQLAIAMGDQKARQIANVNLYETWVERTAVKFRTSRKYLYLEPTDVISAHGYTIRIDRKSATVPGLVEFEGKLSVPPIYIVGLAANPTSGGQQSVATASQPTDLRLLDIPLLQDTDFSQGIYAAAAGSKDSTWRGYTLYESADGGNTYNQVGAAAVANTMGTVTAALPDFGGGNVIDEINRFEVTIGPGGGALAGIDVPSLLNGGNTALVGAELVQFRDATLTAPGIYTCAGLLRGRRGTEFQMGNHTAGEPFIMLPATDINTPFSDLGQFRAYKPVTTGANLASTQEQDFQDNGAALRPYAPVLIFGAPDGSGNVAIVWTRRTRIGGAWLDFTDIPLSEPSELYVLQVWDSTFSTCARVVTGLTSPAFTYTSAMQVTDFGANQQHIYITVGQVGSFGLGVQAQATIPGAGGSDSAPLNPVQPYNTSPPPAPPVTTCTGTVINDTVTWGLVDTLFSPSDFGPGQKWVVKIPVPASPTPGPGRVSAAEYNGPPAPRNAVLSLNPCGAPLTPSSQCILNIGFTFGFWVGVGNPHPQTQVTLLPGTDYYVTVESPIFTSEMIMYFISRG